ncbi:hypothetical protein V8E53_007164 [Lactarius tabidus]
MSPSSPPTAHAHAILARYPSHIAGRPCIAHCPLPIAHRPLPIHCPSSVGAIARCLSFGVRPLALAVVAPHGPLPSPSPPLSAH